MHKKYIFNALAIQRALTVANAGNKIMETSAPFEYTGDESLRQPIGAALGRVVDPEVAMSIVDVGLVYRVAVDDATVHVLMTMTSAACPAADAIVEDVEAELTRVLPPRYSVEVELCWEPAWTPERMSERAKRFMRW